MMQSDDSVEPLEPALLAHDLLSYNSQKSLPDVGLFWLSLLPNLKVLTMIRGRLGGLYHSLCS